MVLKSMGAPTHSPRDAPSRTKHCSRRLKASAALPLSGAAERERSASEAQGVETLIVLRVGASCIRENKKGNHL